MEVEREMLECEFGFERAFASQQHSMRGMSKAGRGGAVSTPERHQHPHCHLNQLLSLHQR